MFALFVDTYLQNPTPELLKAMDAKHKDYEGKGIPLTHRGFVPEEIYDAVAVPDKTYINYKDMKLHISDVVKGLEIAEKHGWVAEDKQYVFVNLTNIKSTISPPNMN